MERVKARFILLLVVLVLAAALHTELGYGVFTPHHDSNHLLAFPTRIAEWKGSRVPLQEQIYRILETNTVLVNQYEHAEDYVNLSIVYYPQMKVEFHTPEQCNSGTGDLVRELGRRNLLLHVNGKTKTVSVNAFTVTRQDGRRDLFYYFFKSGGYLSSSYFRLRLRMMAKYLRSRKADGSMIVLSTPIVKNMSSSEVVLDRFMTSVYPAILHYV